MKKLERYTTRVSKIDNGKPYWNSLRVEILESGKKRGEYVRRYHSLLNTFVPFNQRHEDGSVGEYALFSDDYTRTAVMELPSCKVIAGETGHALGFCPVDFYVPYEEPYNEGNYKTEGIPGRFGFVAGCVWGDDSSWKVQFLDLSKIREGKISRDKRFGYHELPDDMDLKDAVSMEYYEKGYYKDEVMDEELVMIAGRNLFNLKERKDE